MCRFMAVRTGDSNEEFGGGGGGYSEKRGEGDVWILLSGQWKEIRFV